MDEPLEAPNEVTEMIGNVGVGEPTEVVLVGAEMVVDGGGTMELIISFSEPRFVIQDRSRQWRESREPISRRPFLVLFLFCLFLFPLKFNKCQFYSHKCQFYSNPSMLAKISSLATTTTLP